MVHSDTEPASQAPIQWPISAQQGMIQACFASLYHEVSALLRKADGQYYFTFWTLRCLRQRRVVSGLRPSTVGCFAANRSYLPSQRMDWLRQSILRSK